jgi:hypothetical protein
MSYDFSHLFNNHFHLTDANIKSNGRATQRTKSQKFWSRFSKGKWPFRVRRAASGSPVGSFKCHSDGSWQMELRELAARPATERFAADSFIILAEPLVGPSRTINPGIPDVSVPVIVTIWLSPIRAKRKVLRSKT